MSDQNQRSKRKTALYRKKKSRRERFKTSHEELKQKTEEFLKRGGKIKKIESDVTIINDWGDLEDWLNLRDPTGIFESCEL